MRRWMKVVGLWALMVMGSACVCDPGGEGGGVSGEGTPPIPESLSALWFDCTGGRCAELAEGARLQGIRDLRIEISAPPGADLSSSLIVHGDTLAEGARLLLPVLDIDGFPKGQTSLVLRVDVDGARADITRSVFFDGCPTRSEPDEVGDGVDQNCDGVDGVDADRDGIPSVESGGGDCDDTISLIGVCEPGDPSDLSLDDPATAVTEVIVETDGRIGDDLNGDGLPNNALGPLFNDLFAIIDIELNAYLQERIEARLFLMGMGWDEREGSADLSFYNLLDADDDDPDNGRYLVAEDSFLSGSITPRTRFEDVQIDGEGRFEAHTDLVVVPFPFGEAQLKVVIEEATFTGLIERTESGIRLIESRLTGVSSMASLTKAFNDYAASELCGCLGLEGPLIDLSLGSGPQACVGRADLDACTDERQETCTTIAAACPLLVPILNGQADIDTDGDGAPDAASVLITMKGEPASFIGVVR